MELKRRVLTLTVIGSGALSVWGSFYITPYYGKLPKMSNKTLFTSNDCSDERKVCNNLLNCVNINES